MKDNKDDHKQSKIETADTKSETARDRARRKWKNGLSSEQIEQFINNRIKQEIQWKHHEIRAAAKKYAELGFSVIPIRPFEKTPYRTWKSFQSVRLTPDEIDMVWEEYPDAQIGLVTGEVSDLLAVDFDSPEAIENFKEIFGELPDSLCQKTKRGIHVLFKNNPKLRSRNAVIEGLDLKAEGAYFVVAPSIHKSGKHYEWQNFDPLKDRLDNLMDMPSEMVEFFLDNQKKTKTSKSRTSQGYDPVPEGERNTRLTQLVGKWINEGEPKEKTFLLASGWNSTLEKPLDEKEVEAVVESVIRTDKRNNPGRYENNAPSNLVEIFTAPELLGMKLPKPKWAIDGILPEGLTILGGKPKKGKSIFALNICFAIASGNKAFGEIDIEKGSVIYLALEDSKKRIQNRLKAMIPYGRFWVETNNFIIATRWPRMGEGGLSMLEEEIKKHDNLRLVIIDTLAKFRQPSTDSKYNYHHDYVLTDKLKTVADKHEAPFLVAHHVRKAEAEDVMDTFSGTFGLTAPADCLMVYKRTGSNTELHIAGRDVEETAYALEFTKGNESLKLLGELKNIQSSKAKQSVYDILKDSGGELSVSEIVDLTDMQNIYIRKAVSKLAKEGKITRVKRGVYKI